MRLFILKENELVKRKTPKRTEENAPNLVIDITSEDSAQTLDQRRKEKNMGKANGKKSMTVYCERCGYEAEYNKPPPLKCPKCRQHKLSFEKDREWDPLCQVWAAANGYPIGAKNYSLPRWVFENHKMEEWEDFKATISDHEANGPPPLLDDSYQVVDFWWKKTGLKSILIRGLNAFPIHGGTASDEDAENFLTKDPKVKSLMFDYFNFWKKKGVIN